MKAVFLLACLCAAARAGWLSGEAASIDGPRQLFQAGRYEKVVGALGDGLLQKLRGADQQDGYYYLGLSYERLGRLDKALGVYQLGVKLFPRDINLLTQLAMLLHTSGLEEQAEPLFQKVLAIHPNNAAAHLGLAQIDHSLGFLDLSVAHYQKALETMGDNPAVWREYSEVSLDRRDYATAEQAARRALALSSDPDGMLDLARALRASGRLDQAIATLDLAAQRFPRRRDLSLARALWRLEEGRYDEALPLAQALLAAPDPPALAYWIRARVELKRDGYQAAVADLRSAAASEGDDSSFVAAASEKLLALLGAR
ncbi:MAG: tetratricopeptide repeat protein [Elusimicrobia bacterium]|nr:tetratricopeptide repeat protein [Elusimicrobiota bacterium]MDE2425351.1 tetratricopeptide repeat protein [Elusimicrobiota bacterium]